MEAIFGVFSTPFFLAPMLLLYELWKLWRSYPCRAETR